VVSGRPEDIEDQLVPLLVVRKRPLVVPAKRLAPLTARDWICLFREVGAIAVRVYSGCCGTERSQIVVPAKTLFPSPESARILFVVRPEFTAPSYHRYPLS